MKGRTPSAEQKRFHSMPAEHIGCVASRMDGFVDFHFSIHHIEGRTKPDAQWLVLPLSAGNHQDGTGAPGRIAVHPWKARFEARYGRQRVLLVWCIEQLQAQGLDVPEGALRAAGMRGARMNYYPHHIGDFNSATRHLTRLERSVYRDMLDLYYDTEAPLSLDLDVLCRLLIARSDDERTAVQQVLNEFFTETDEGWRHERCDGEIAKYHDQRVAKSAAGRASAAKRAEKAQQALNTRSTPVEQPDHDCATNQNHNQNHIKDIPPTPRKRGNSFDASSIDLPDWLDREDWQAWVADRKARKKPVTEEGAKRQLHQLAAYRGEGHKPADVIANSIAGGYQGLFPPRAQAQARAGSPSRGQAMADWNDELTRELRGEPNNVIDMGTIDATH